MRRNYLRRTAIRSKMSSKLVKCYQRVFLRSMVSGLNDKDGFESIGVTLKPWRLELWERKEGRDWE